MQMEGRLVTFTEDILDHCGFVIIPMNVIKPFCYATLFKQSFGATKLELRFDAFCVEFLTLMLCTWQELI
jgi:hypothetical protein